MIDHVHTTILLNPKLTNDDIVNTTCGVGPGVGFIISEKKEAKDRESQMVQPLKGNHTLTHFALRTAFIFHRFNKVLESFLGFGPC